jgi:hypothetical protein
MSKWWARRRSSVFRSTLLAAAMRAPDDPSKAAKAVWDVYYANHQKKGALKHLKVADIFMGGGTTIVEGARLGMQMWGIDLNPVAWFIVKTEMAQVNKEEVESLLADIEAEVKPQIMPFYACNCPRGHKGVWKKKATGEVMGASFDPLALKPDERKNYTYDGPEIIYVFWAKHGPCQVTGCGHRTPIMSSPAMAVKELTVKVWPRTCKKCKVAFDIEDGDARMAPGVPFVVADTEKPFVVLDHHNHELRCPKCGHTEERAALGTKGEKKKISLSLLVHPQWLKGDASGSKDGKPYGGSVSDTAEDTARWNEVRGQKLSLLEARGVLPEIVKCPHTGIEFNTSDAGGTRAFEFDATGGRRYVKSSFACAAAGHRNDLLESVHASGKTAPVAAYAIQGYCPSCERDGRNYGGRFFSPASAVQSLFSAWPEWEARRDGDLSGWWPDTEVPEGLETRVRTPLHKYGYSHWWMFFNSRQLLGHALLLRSISTVGTYSVDVRDLVLAAFQQYLRNNNMFCIWNIQADKLEPFQSKNNLQPPSRPIENCVFGALGRGTWRSSNEGISDTFSWRENPWELVAKEGLHPSLASAVGTARSVKTTIGDPFQDGTRIEHGSSTALPHVLTGSVDLVVTDPPFGDIMQYSELSGFSYAWLRRALGSRYEIFRPPHPPTALEAVENDSRNGEESGAFYKRLLTECWREANRIVKASGLLAFTFHHDKDEPWVAVLESLFDAGFILEAAYPVRSDETKGEGSNPGTFGAQKVEYDVLHVCRKRTEEPNPTSWAKMRREVLAEVRQLKAILEHHRQEGLPEADLQVIRRGKALEYFSRHYGKVFVDADRPISVKDALVGINQLLDEEAGAIKQPPPSNAEPMTRQFLRLFDGTSGVPRDQIQKMLRGTGTAPSDFEARGWCYEEKKVFHQVSALDIAQAWQGKHRKGMVSDYDQAMFLIGACHDGSGIDATGTLNNDNFKAHTALAGVVDWFITHGATQTVRNAASRASGILRTWLAKQKPQPEQMRFLYDTEAVS